jgi:hypothetical protein
MTEHQDWKLVNVFAATIPNLTFAPGVHVNYQETVLIVKDGPAQDARFPEGARRIWRDSCRILQIPQNPRDNF